MMPEAIPLAAPTTLAAAFTATWRALADAGVPQPRLDARILVCTSAEVPPEAILMRGETAMSPGDLARLGARVRRRARREPVARILGQREFWSLPFRVTPDVLDPRPDSETLVAAALELLPEREASYRLLDLGTGSGCLLLALLSALPRATGVGVDIAAAAIAVARDNAAALGLEARARFVIGDWGDAPALAGAARFNLIVTNPPYLDDDDMAHLAPEVARFAPRLALAGGVDGLDCYRAMAPGLPHLIAPGGSAVLEIGHRQADAVTAILGESGLVATDIRRDLGHRPRCVVARPAGVRKP